MDLPRCGGEAQENSGDRKGSAIPAPLDPDAEGVLPVCLGKATRAADMLTDQTKTYEAGCFCWA